MAHKGVVAHGSSDPEELANTLYGMVRDGHIPAVLGAFKHMIREKRSDILDRLILRLVGEGQVNRAKQLLKQKADPVLAARGWLTLIEETTDVSEENAFDLILCVNVIHGQEVRQDILLQLCGFIGLESREGKTGFVTFILQKLNRWDDRFFVHAWFYAGRSPHQA